MSLVVNADKIEKIYVNKARLTYYPNFHPKIPPKYTFFNLIKVEDAKDDRWCNQLGESFPTREEAIKGDNTLFIDYSAPFEQSIFRKPNLNIVMSHSDNVTVYYDDENSMKTALNSIVEASNNNLIVVEN